MSRELFLRAAERVMDGERGFHWACYAANGYKDFGNKADQILLLMHNPDEDAPRTDAPYQWPVEHRVLAFCFAAAMYERHR